MNKQELWKKWIAANYDLDFKEEFINDLDSVVEYEECVGLKKMLLEKYSNDIHAEEVKAYKSTAEEMKIFFNKISSGTMRGQ